MSLQQRLRLDRMDIRALLGVIVIDLALTTYGIHFQGGAELSPLFRPFTEAGLGATLAGAGLYLGIVLVLNRLIDPGRARTTLLTTAVGMHAMGVVTWVTGLLYPPLGLRWATVYGYLTLVALVTAATQVWMRSRDWLD